MLRIVRLGPCFTLLSLALAISGILARAADAPSAPPPSERALISLLQSNSPKAEKALACKQLAVYGGKEAVPALAKLLADPELASWARIPLEVIPDPAADAALRKALGKLQGNLLVGTINSIGVRRDPKAVSDLVKKLKDPNVEVVSASADALGRIGGSKAAKALTRSLTTAPAAARPAVAEGCIRCAEAALAQSRPAEAVKLYDAVRAADVPKNKQLEGIRGAILARQSQGLPLLLEQLRSADRGSYGIGLTTARELPGRAVTEALAAELRQCRPERQSFLLLALADRTDDAVMPVVLEALKSGSPKLRLTAVSVLERQGNLSTVPALLNAATDADPQLAQAALGALARLPGSDVDADLLARCASANGKSRQVLVTLAGQRHIDRALPVVLRSAEDPDAGVRGAAVQTIGILGTEAQAADLVRLLQATPSTQERGDLEMALLAIGGRSGARSVPAVLPLAQNDDPALRIIALHLLASAGGPKALSAVEAAVQDKDSTVQDEAVRTLSTWPNNWPEDNGVAAPLLALAKSDAKATHQVLALRGYLQYLQGDKALSSDEKLAKLDDVLPLMKRPEEKRLAIAAIGTAPNSRALEMLLAYAEDSALAEDAYSAIVKLAEASGSAVPQDQRRKALQLVVKKSSTDATKREARKMLK